MAKNDCVDLCFLDLMAPNKLKLHNVATIAKIPVNPTINVYCEIIGLGTKKFHVIQVPMDIPIMELVMMIVEN